MNARAALACEGLDGKKTNEAGYHDAQIHCKQQWKYNSETTRGPTTEKLDWSLGELNLLNLNPVGGIDAMQ